MAGDLKDQLKAWKTEHGSAVEPPAPKKKKSPGLTPKQARRAAERARLEAAEAAARGPYDEDDEALEHLSDDELFEKAVTDIGDGSVAILEKYGHGHLSGEGPERPRRAAKKNKPEPEPDEEGKPNASETNLFLDFVGDAKPVK